MVFITPTTMMCNVILEFYRGARLMPFVTAPSALFIFKKKSMIFTSVVSCKGLHRICGYISTILLLVKNQKGSYYRLALEPILG